MTQIHYYRNTDKTANIGDLVVVEVGFRGTPDKYVGKTAVVYSTANDDDRCTDGSTNDLQLVFEDGVRSAWWEAGHLRLIKTDEFAIAQEWIAKRSKPCQLKTYVHANSLDCWIIRNKKDGRLWGIDTRSWPVGGTHAYGWTYDATGVYRFEKEPLAIMAELGKEDPDLSVFDSLTFKPDSKEQMMEVIRDGLIVKVKVKQSVQLVTV